MEKNEKENIMNDYIIYCRFANANNQFSLDTKRYCFHYRREYSSYLVGSIINIKDEGRKNSI